VEFFKGRNYFRGIGDALQRLGKKSKTHKNRMLALSHSFPLSFLIGHGGNMREIGRSMKNWKYVICRKNQ